MKEGWYFVCQETAGAKGICGSGIIDLAVAMVQTGALDFAGKLNIRHPGVRTAPATDEAF